MGNTHVKPHPRSRNKKQVHWKAADRPSPPGKPQLVTDNEATPDLITIRWSKPAKDGGSPISGYLVEHRRTGSPHWVRATPVLVPFPELTISGLEPGWRYQFRVSAENAVGISDPGELSEPITVTLQRSAITAPRFTQELNDAVALENEKIEFIVHFLGQPAPKVCWFKDGFEIFSSRRIRILTEHDKSILTIHQCALSDEGEIKCTATNRAGHISTKANLQLEAPPAIRLPRQYEEGLLFEIGELIRLKVSVAGKPTPLVFWSHNGESIQNNDRYETENKEKSSILKINEAERTDRGEYQIKAVNKLGEDCTSFLVTVTDKPSPPGKARVIMTLGRSVTLSWATPNDDGGCKIGNYIVEYYRLGWNVWLKAATSRQLTTILGDLIEGSEYKFRIKAESPYGISEPSEETEVVFIPDPKRGITQPTHSRGRSQPRDILDDMSVPVAAKRKNKPRSFSTGRVEDRTNDSNIQHNIFNAGIPKRPERTKIKSPPKTPELSPMPDRKIKDSQINKSIFDRSSMARDLAYGSPEIKVKRDMERNNDDYLLNYTTSNTSKTPSPEMHKSQSNEQNAGNERGRSLSISSEKSRSPSPAPLRSKSPRENHDNYTGSSEFMLVLYPDENERDQGSSEYNFDFDDNSVPPPMSLSAPELSVEPPLLLNNLRSSSSSTELLHERAMIRFYQAAEAEEAEMEKRRKATENKRHSVDIPRIQINSLDDQDIVGLERKHSLRRRLSAGGITQQQALWAQRRQSLKTPKEINDILPQNNLHKYTPEDKRELMMLRQRSESEEKEEEEFDKVRQKMVLEDKVSFEKRKISVVDEEKWADDYEESTEEESEYSDEDEDDYQIERTGKRISICEEDDIVDVDDSKTNNEPFEILTKRKNPPDPNFVPKPILKKTEEAIPYVIDKVEIKNKEDSKKKIRSHSPMPLDFVQRERSQSLVEQLLDPLTFIPSAEKMFNSNKSPKPRQRSFSLISQTNTDSNLPTLGEIKEEKPSLEHNIRKVAEITGITAASIVIPQSLLKKKKDEEEAKVVVDHYGDILKSYSQRKRNNSLTMGSDKSLASTSKTSDPNVFDNITSNNNNNAEKQIEPTTYKREDITNRKGLSLQHESEKPKIEENKIFERVETYRREDITNKKEPSPTQNLVKPSIEENKMFDRVETYKREDITNKKELSPKLEKRNPRNVSVSPQRKPKRTPSQSPGRRNKSHTKSPVRHENWDNYRRTNINEREYKRQSKSPSPAPRKKSPSPSNLVPRHRPMLREIMTQTSVGLESFSGESRTSTPGLSPRQEELASKAEIKVKSVIDYITDLTMFIVACWLYLFNNELLAIPVLLIMIYRQLTEEIKKRFPKRLLNFFRKKKS